MDLVGIETPIDGSRIPKSTLFRPSGTNNVRAWIKIKAEIEKSSSVLITLLNASSEWHSVDDGYESGVGQCQLKSSPVSELLSSIEASWRFLGVGKISVGIGLAVSWRGSDHAHKLWRGGKSGCARLSLF
jgi:hypothetical protein